MYCTVHVHIPVHVHTYKYMYTIYVFILFPISSWIKKMQFEKEATGSGSVVSMCITCEYTFDHYSAIFYRNNNKISIVLI